MKSFEIEIREPDSNLTLRIDPAERASLAQLLHRHNHPLNTRCGQRGLCNSCTIELLTGSAEHIPTGKIASGESQLIRACEFRPAGNVVIRIPPHARLSYAPQVLDDFDIRITAARDPLVSAKWGVAVDLGTTTVALLLVDLTAAKIAARASAFNTQMHLGDDVVTRISLCASDPQMLPRMQSAILNQTIEPLLHQTLSDAGARMPDIGAIVIAGNTTMLHLLSGEDPASLGVAPFTPRFTQHRILPAKTLWPHWDAAAGNIPVHLLPSASAYIGADIVAGVVASSLAYETETAMLVDIGTNGEIVLRHNDRLLACATAAGPAFEGARLRSGLRAGQGAITDFRFDPQSLRQGITWIGQADLSPPVGLCGSAFIDFLAEARRINLLSPTGRFNRQLAASLNSNQTADKSFAFRIAPSQARTPILIDECDIAALLAAKAAIAAGITLLLRQCNIEPRDVRKLYLAGGFGTHMNPANAIAMGLLPGFVPGQVIPIGNSALAGAYLALIDHSLVDDMQRTAAQIQPIDLNSIPEFEDVFIDMLSLP